MMSEHPCHNLSNTDKQIFTCRHCMAKFYDPIKRWRHSKTCKKDKDAVAIDVTKRPVSSENPDFVQKKRQKVDNKCICVICHTTFSTMNEMREHVKQACNKTNAPKTLTQPEVSPQLDHFEYQLKQLKETRGEDAATNQIESLLRAAQALHQQQQDQQRQQADQLQGNVETEPVPGGSNQNWLFNQEQAFIEETDFPNYPNLEGGSDELQVVRVEQVSSSPHPEGDRSLHTPPITLSAEDTHQTYTEPQPQTAKEQADNQNQSDVTINPSEITLPSECVVKENSSQQMCVQSGDQEFVLIGFNGSLQIPQQVQPIDENLVIEVVRSNNGDSSMSSSKQLTSLNIQTTNNSVQSLLSSDSYTIGQNIDQQLNHQLGDSTQNQAAMNQQADLQPNNATNSQQSDIVTIPISNQKPDTPMIESGNMVRDSGESSNKNSEEFELIAQVIGNNMNNLQSVIEKTISQEFGHNSDINGREHQGDHNNSLNNSFSQLDNELFQKTLPLDKTNYKTCEQNSKDEPCEKTTNSRDKSDVLTGTQLLDVNKDLFNHSEQNKSLEAEVAHLSESTKERCKSCEIKAKSKFKSNPDGFCNINKGVDEIDIECTCDISGFRSHLLSQQSNVIIVHTEKSEDTSLQEENKQISKKKRKSERIPKCRICDKEFKTIELLRKHNKVPCKVRLTRNLTQKVLRPKHFVKQLPPTVKKKKKKQKQIPPKPKMMTFDRKFSDLNLDLFKDKKGKLKTRRKSLYDYNFCITRSADYRNSRLDVHMEYDTLPEKEQHFFHLGLVSTIHLPGDYKTPRSLIKKVLREPTGEGVCVLEVEEDTVVEDERPPVLEKVVDVGNHIQDDIYILQDEVNYDACPPVLLTVDEEKKMDQNNEAIHLKNDSFEIMEEQNIKEKFLVSPNKDLRISAKENNLSPTKSSYSSPSKSPNKTLNERHFMDAIDVSSDSFSDGPEFTQTKEKDNTELTSKEEKPFYSVTVGLQTDIPTSTDKIMHPRSAFILKCLKRLETKHKDKLSTVVRNSKKQMVGRKNLFESLENVPLNSNQNIQINDNKSMEKVQLKSYSVAQNANENHKQKELLEEVIVYPKQDIKKLDLPERPDITKDRNKEIVDEELNFVESDKVIRKPCDQDSVSPENGKNLLQIIAKTLGIFPTTKSRDIPERESKTSDLSNAELKSIEKGTEGNDGMQIIIMNNSSTSEDYTMGIDVINVPKSLERKLHAAAEDSVELEDDSSNDGDALIPDKNATFQNEFSAEGQSNCNGNTTEDMSLPQEVYELLQDYNCDNFNSAPISMDTSSSQIIDTNSPQLIDTNSQQIITRDSPSFISSNKYTKQSLDTTNLSVLPLSHSDSNIVDIHLNFCPEDMITQVVTERDNSSYNPQLSSTDTSHASVHLNHAQTETSVSHFHNQSNNIHLIQESLDPSVELTNLPSVEMVRPNFHNQSDSIQESLNHSVQTNDANLDDSVTGTVHSGSPSIHKSSCESVHANHALSMEPLDPNIHNQSEQIHESMHGSAYLSCTHLEGPETQNIRNNVLIKKASDNTILDLHSKETFSYEQLSDSNRFNNATSFRNHKNDEIKINSMDELYNENGEKGNQSGESFKANEQTNDELWSRIIQEYHADRQKSTENKCPEAKETSQHSVSPSKNGAFLISEQTSPELSSPACLPPDRINSTAVGRSLHSNLFSLSNINLENNPNTSSISIYDKMQSTEHKIVQYEQGKNRSTDNILIQIDQEKTVSETEKLCSLENIDRFQNPEKLSSIEDVSRLQSAPDSESVPYVIVDTGVEIKRTALSLEDDDSDEDTTHEWGPVSDQETIYSDFMA